MTGTTTSTRSVWATTARRKRHRRFAEAAAHVPFRWLVPLVYPMAQTIRPFLHDAGAAAEEADAIAVAFTKSLLLQIRLWSRPYVGDAEW